MDSPFNLIKRFADTAPPEFLLLIQQFLLPSKPLSKPFYKAKLDNTCFQKTEKRHQILYLGAEKGRWEEAANWSSFLLFFHSESPLTCFSTYRGIDTTLSSHFSPYAKGGGTRGSGGGSQANK